MAEFKISSDKITEAMNNEIARFPTSLQAGKEALSLVRSEIKVDNLEPNASGLTNIEKR